uniref:Uncharacterized protein n=1 Tax=Monodelphis domestica TaxID=13616 RepID=A0A5F8H1X7_MONDO
TSVSNSNFTCWYCMILSKSFPHFHPSHQSHFCRTAVILDLLNTNFKFNQAVISGMVTVYTVVCFLIFFLY